MNFISSCSSIFTCLYNDCKVFFLVNSRFYYLLFFKYCLSLLTALSLLYIFHFYGMETNTCKFLLRKYVCYKLPTALSYELNRSYALFFASYALLDRNLIHWLLRKNQHIQFPSWCITFVCIISFVHWLFYVYYDVYNMIYYDVCHLSWTFFDKGIWR